MPEQWDEHGTIGVTADVYAFGVLLYELICGRRPFELPAGFWHATPELYRRMHLEELPFDPRQFRDSIPENLAGLMLSCLEKEATARPADFGLIAGALLGCYAAAAEHPYSRQEPKESTVRTLNSLLCRGVSMFELGQYEKAFSLFKFASAISPERPDVWIGLGFCQLCCTAGSVEGARDCFAKAISASDDVEDVFHSLAVGSLTGTLHAIPHHTD